MTGKRLIALIRREVALLFTLQRSDRPWQLPVASAITSGAPIMLGVATGHPAQGAMGGIASLAFIYLPPYPLFQRVPIMMACSFLMLAGYALGALSSLAPDFALPVLTLVTIGATLFCKLYSLAPPGPIFIVMGAAIAAFAPMGHDHAIENIGFFAMGILWACFMALLYSIMMLGRRLSGAMLNPAMDWDNALIDALVAGLFVALSLGLALLLNFEKPYWVPVSCLAVLQGNSLRASWARNLHRIVGTCIGLGFTALLLPLVKQPWALVTAIMVLTFIIETVVVRNYAFAAAFITPLAVILGESSHPGVLGIPELMMARMVDTVVGALLGLMGAYCLHRPAWRGAIRAFLVSLGLVAKRADLA